MLQEIFLLAMFSPFMSSMRETPRALARGWIREMSGSPREVSNLEMVLLLTPIHSPSFAWVRPLDSRRARMAAPVMYVFVVLNSFCLSIPQDMCKTQPALRRQGPSGLSVK